MLQGKSCVTAAAALMREPKKQMTQCIYERGPKKQRPQCRYTKALSRKKEPLVTSSLNTKPLSETVKGVNAADTGRYEMCSRTECVLVQKVISYRKCF
jgi:hypothetical protein